MHSVIYAEITARLQPFDYRSLLSEVIVIPVRINTEVSVATRFEQLRQALNSRILVIDGAMGTAIQARNLTAADFGGPQYEGCNEYLVLTKPAVISEIHEEYLAAGCDIVETNTFGGTPLVLD